MDGVAYLIGQEYPADESGNPLLDAYGNQVTKELQPRMIYVTEKSVSRQEFFAAAQHGFSPEHVLEVFPLDYRGERKAELNGERYAVYRTYYDAKAERMELYLTREEARDGEAARGI